MYCFPDIIGVIKSRRMRIRNLAHLEKMKNAHKILIRKPRTGCVHMDSIHLEVMNQRQTSVNMVMNVQVLLRRENLLTS